jgi:tetratricopeptide (TPR) repeat protein
MTFDRTKAMRNAERFVAQGKIKAAIAEYRRVVEHDPRDISTTNMLGDLLVKNSDKTAAVAFYAKVAEHYAAQGFAQKAIAVYNKIIRLQGKSMAMTEKLAELYALKGSMSEARHHYLEIAEHHSKNKRPLEALAIWKQIATLDPTDTEVCVSLGDSYLREGQSEEAAEAFADAGFRFAKKSKHDKAIEYLAKSLELRGGDLRVLEALVASHCALGATHEAIRLLEGVFEKEPFNRDVLYLLVGCLIDSNDAVGAERAVVKLVELEPANHTRLLEVVRMHLDASDIDSAVRVLSMCVEYMLAAGEVTECRRWTDEILERDPEHLGALRLLVRQGSWQKDEEQFRDALERLANSARKVNQYEDECYALAHLTAICPHETEFAERLMALKTQYGVSPDVIEAEILASPFALAAPDSGAEPAVVELPVSDAVIERNGNVSEPASEPSFAGEAKLERQLDSIAFYIENGYDALAETTLDELEAEFGARDEISAMRSRLGAGPASDFNGHAANGNGNGNSSRVPSLNLDDIRSEFGVDEIEPASESDFDTHFHTAVAYQGMGLVEQAICEFQNAINLVRDGDGTRRFFECSNLLGHCFLIDGRPRHAVTWFNRALATEGLSPEEKQGLWYELGLALEAEGDLEAAGRYFEQVYAEDVDFRDVAQRVKALSVAR